MRWDRLLGLACLAAVAPTVARAGCSVGRIAELPVTMSGLTPTVPAKINGVDVRFVADSGAFFSMISPAVAAQLKLVELPVRPGFRLEGVGGETSVTVATVKTFTLVGTAVPRLDFLVGGSGTGAGTVGLLGQNVLGLADVEYDLQHGAIRLMRPHGCERTDMAYWSRGKPYSVVTLDWRDDNSPHTTATVTLNGAPMRALFDTGANTSVVTLAAAKRAGIRVGDPGVTPAGVMFGIGRGRANTWIAPIASFKVGDEEVKNSHIRIGDLGATDVDMLLGEDFFLSHRMYVANGQHKLYLSYEGGPVFNLTTDPAEHAAPIAGAASTVAGETPTTADGFSRRGAALAARREYAAAEADFSRAVTLAPEDPEPLRLRALVRMESGRRALAGADLDAALKLKPSDVASRLLRAELRLAANDRDGARQDADAAAAAASRQADARLDLAQFYDTLEAYEPALAQFDLWIGAHEADSRQGEALNGRCWARALLGRELDRALADCNAALRRNPGSAEYLDSRGLVRLRRGEYARAIADYDAALKLRPKTAWSLYGRGLAELRSGRAEAGRADLAAASALSPTLPARAHALGVDARPSAGPG